MLEEHAALSLEEPVTLLLGLHVERPGSYYALLGDEPLTSSLEAPGYKTLIVHFDGNRVRLTGELPYLAIPEERGFLFVGESSVDVDEAEDREAMQMEPPRFYSASRLWKTNTRRRIRQVRQATRSALLRERRWGVTQQQTVWYVTPKALCQLDSESHWIGGAHAVAGSEALRLHWLDGTKGRHRLLQQVARPVFADAAERLLRELYEGRSDPIVLDEPQDLGWQIVDWARDTYACLTRHEGQVMLSATASLNTMSARQTAVETPVHPAYEELGGRKRTSVTYSRLHEAVPDLADAYVSPGHELVILHLPKKLVIYRPGGEPLGLQHPERDWHRARVALEIPVTGRPVLEEWAIGNHAKRWVRELGPQ